MLRTWLKRLAAVLRKSRLDRELSEEVRTHLEMATEENLRRGMNAEQAREAARRSFGGLEQVKEAYRDQRGVPLVESLWQDLRYGIRVLRKSPGFTAVAVLSLAIGIGANTAIFTLVDQLMIRALPIENPDEVVLLNSPGPNPGMVRRSGSFAFSYLLYVDLREQTEVFSGMLAHFPLRLALSAQGEVEQINGELVSGNSFEVLGLRPALGRLFTAADDQKPEAHPVAVLSHEFWQRRFNADPAVVGRALTLNERAMTVVGVAPRGFRGLDVGTPFDVMVPLMMAEPMTVWRGHWSRRASWLNLYARLKPGVSRSQAESALNLIYPRILQREAQEMQGVPESVRERFRARRIEVLSGARGNSGLRSVFSQPLLVLMSMVGLVLLIACINLAGLLTARAANRQKETVLRLAIGAGRGRIVRQFLLESLILAFSGAVAGVGLAYWAAASILHAIPVDDISRSLLVSPDGRVLGFTAGLTVLTALLFGLTPALQATRAALAPALKSDPAGTGERAKSRLRSGLISLQVALSVLLLAAAGAFSLTLYNLRNVDLGFQPRNLLSFEVNPADVGTRRGQRADLIAKLLAEFQSLPGLDAVSFALDGPLNSSNRMTIRIDGSSGPDSENLTLPADLVGPRYFSAIGLGVLAGREFTDRDRVGQPRVAVINRAMAERYFRGEDPIGRRISFAYENPPQPLEIVGVVKDSKLDEVREESQAAMYVPYLQNGYTAVHFFARTTLPTLPVTAMIRERFRTLAMPVPKIRIVPVETWIDQNLYIERIIAAGAVSFGLIAALLAGIGLYGVVAYSVERRTKEIGVRIALGATRRDLVWMVVNDIARIVILGTMAGVAGCLMLGRLVESLLYGVSATNPVLIATAVGGIVLVALAAAALPSRRAASVDPTIALRNG